MLYNNSESNAAISEYLKYQNTFSTATVFYQIFNKHYPYCCWFGILKLYKYNVTDSGANNREESEKLK